MRRPPVYIFLMAIMLTSCSRPDKMQVFKSPRDSVFYTVETTYGHGATSSDATDVYAHLVVDGNSEKMLVLHGLYLEVSGVVWNSSSDVTLCVARGMTSTFRSEVTLSVGDTSVTIRNRLVEQGCS